MSSWQDWSVGLIPIIRFTCDCHTCNEELGDSQAGHYIDRYVELKQRLGNVETGDEEEIFRIHIDIEEILKENNCKIIWRILNLEEALGQTLHKKDELLLELGPLRLILNN